MTKGANVLITPSLFYGCLARFVQWAAALRGSGARRQGRSSGKPRALWQAPGCVQRGVRRRKGKGEIVVALKCRPSPPSPPARTPLTRSASDGRELLRFFCCSALVVGDTWGKNILFSQNSSARDASRIPSQDLVSCSVLLISFLQMCFMQMFCLPCDIRVGWCFGVSEDAEIVNVSLRSWLPRLAHLRCYNSFTTYSWRCVFHDQQRVQKMKILNCVLRLPLCRWRARRVSCPPRTHWTRSWSITDWPKWWMAS